MIKYEQPYGISDLEILFNEAELSSDKLEKLIKTLQNERNAWLSNAKQLQKQIVEIEKELNRVGEALRQSEEKFSKMFSGDLI